MNEGITDIFKRYGNTWQRWSILDWNSILTQGSYGNLDCLVTLKSVFYSATWVYPLWSYLGVLEYYRDASWCFGLRLHSRVKQGFVFFMYKW